MKFRNVGSSFHTKDGLRIFETHLNLCRISGSNISCMILSTTPTYHSILGSDADDSTLASSVSAVQAWKSLIENYSICALTYEKEWLSVQAELGG
jgi:hypothetical protein